MSSMSKRAQARTERELQEILALPGNSICADCGARNPAWASWSLGIFLCIRCATLHRKLGTHISKVKSLSMDTWNNEQVENMRKNGNIAVNKIYNPKNRRPDVPLDADEVDNAMERFIRKKYQEKSLSDGRPEVPIRDIPPQTRSRSPDSSPPPVLPAKKKGFWTGFGLRASSSAYPLSKHDKKHRNEPTVDTAFRITSEDHSSTRQSSAPKELSDRELQKKVSQLRDMGFTDTERNTQLLRKSKGDVERTIAALVKLGPSEKELAQRKTPEPAKTLRSSASATPVSQSSAKPGPQASSFNPFDALDQVPQQAAPAQTAQHQPQLGTLNTNPWQASLSPQQSPGLEQQFAHMQLAPQPLFPHNTGGYAMSQPTAREMPHYHSATASPILSNNPFVQQTPLSAHSTGSNPYASHIQNVPSFAPSTNPFLADQLSASQQTSPSLTNPFGLPPSQTPVAQNQSYSSIPQTQQNVFDTLGQPTQNYQIPQPQPQSRFPYQSMSPSTSSPNLPNFQYGQPQNLPQQQQIQPYNPFQQQQWQQPQPMLPQQTGRYDKASILAMYNYPQLAPQQPLASIPEPTEAPAQPLSPAPAPAPASNPYSQASNLNSGKRSATMPVSSTTSSPSISSPPSASTRNPFYNNMNASNINGAYAPTSQTSYPTSQFLPNGSQSANPYHPPGGARHASADSVAVNNPTLMDGRHSPDAWGGLSARHV